MFLGLHCSIRQGFLEALNYAESLKAQAIQILPYRRHADPEEEDYAGFVQRLSRSSVKRLYVHSRFVPNLALNDEKKRLSSTARLAYEMSLAARLNAEAFVLHLGAYSEGDSISSGIDLAARSIYQARQEAEKSVSLCVENVPGGGRRLGGKLEELASFAEALQKEDAKIPVSFCLDTAHAWAAGYSIADCEGMSRFLKRASELLGKDKIRLFHLNDTRSELNSHRESHSLWGQGVLGFEGLKCLLSAENFRDCSGILESPKPGGAERLNFKKLEELNS